MPSGGVLRFGPYRLDLRGRRLLSGDTPIPLQRRQYDLLYLFVSRAGELLSRQTLLDEVWRDVHVHDNSVDQAVSTLRRILDPAHPHLYIETVPRQGYRFVARVAPGDLTAAPQDIEVSLAPYRAGLEGRDLLESLQYTKCVKARESFGRWVSEYPRIASLHVGLANACILGYEASRVDVTPDLAALDEGTRHGRIAIELDPLSGEAWSTLGFGLGRRGFHPESLPALRKGVDLAPDDWANLARLAFGSWGGQRMRALRRLLGELPGCAMAYWMMATVYVPRLANDHAAEAVRNGRASMSIGEPGSGRFTVMGLDWIDGLLCLDAGDVDRALEAFARERALEPNDHIYAREIIATTCYAMGACYLRLGEVPAARAAFEQALERVPHHPLALAGLVIVARREGRMTPGIEAIVRTFAAAAPGRFEAVLARAVLLADAGDHAEAARIIGAAIAAAPPGSTGWIVPIEPQLRVRERPVVWAEVLRVIKDRAS